MTASGSASKLRRLALATGTTGRSKIMRSEEDGIGDGLSTIVATVSNGRFTRIQETARPNARRPSTEQVNDDEVDKDDDDDDVDVVVVVVVVATPSAKPFLCKNTRNAAAVRSAKAP